MNPRFCLTSCAAFGSLLLLPVTPAFPQSTTVAIRGATVVDVTDGSLLPERTVLIEGARITAIGAVENLEIPIGAQIVDAVGGYLIPGLWDMHVHAANEQRVQSFFPLFLANGITGVRDMWGSLEVADSVRAAVESGVLAGPPRIVVAGNLVDGPTSRRSTAIIADGPEEGRRIVDSLHAAGVPFVKVYTRLSRETYLAIAERSRELGIPFAGHVPTEVSFARASEEGQRSMEHVYPVVMGCSTEAEDLADRFARGERLPGSEQTALVLDTQDEGHCRRLADLFIENETWQVPTLIQDRGFSYFRELAAASDPRVRYFTPPDLWFPESQGDPADGEDDEDEGPSEWEVQRVQYERVIRENYRLLAELGVPILAGSDTPNPWVFPGFGLHDELELLVEVGLTPLQALQAATLNPARFFGRTDELGTVAEGKLADLVLLDANPLEDITNTQRIRAVIADGRLYHRKDLDQVLADVEALVQQGEQSQ